MSIIHTSDKIFWHDYINFYEAFFSNRNFNRIAEIGVLRGNSIRWLLERFPTAQIYGGDILPYQVDWPNDPRFFFMQFDQGNINSLREFFSQSQFDLIIEDGSHEPEHQSLALIEGLKILAPNGIYILEDIHTSHPKFNLGNKSNLIRGSSLTSLLAIDHYKKIGQPLNDYRLNLISKNSHFSEDDILFISNKVESIHLYKRTKLPDYCYNCNSIDFNFDTLRCQCGVEVFNDADSMSFVLKIKN